MDRKLITEGDYARQQFPLPWDIDRVVKAGYFDEAREMIALRLKDPRVPDLLRSRLSLELSVMERLMDRYRITPEEAVAMMHEKGVVDFTSEELEMIRKRGLPDWRYINGEVRYLDTFADTLCRVEQSYRDRMVGGPLEEPNPVDDILAHIEDGMPMSAHIHIRHSLHFDEEKLQEGRKLHVHLPIPKAGINDQMHNIRILETSHIPVAVADGDSLQPTIYFEEMAQKGVDFSVEYEFDHHLTYHDCTNEKAAAKVHGDLPEDVKKYLEEKLPHITFTPFLKALAAEIVGEETNLLKKARLIYNYISTHITYRFQPDYAAIDCAPEYCAVNSYGDCGIYALMFITLCRISGIPAKWQSGICARPGDIGEHDWAQFYIPGMGWLFADLSMGASGYRIGRLDRWNFYFGNIDPYRIPINEEVCEAFVPEKKYERRDPTDNQAGEAEYEDGACGFDSCERVYEDLGIC